MFNRDPKSHLKRFHLILAPGTWKLIAKLNKMYVFTDEQIEAAVKDPKGFIGTADNVDCYVQKPFK